MIIDDDDGHKRGSGGSCIHASGGKTLWGDVMGDNWQPPRPRPPFHREPVTPVPYCCQRPVKLKHVNYQSRAKTLGNLSM